MAIDRIKEVASHLAGVKFAPQPISPDPFDPLSPDEIEAAVAIVRRDKGSADERFFFNAVSLSEPPKAELQAWLENRSFKPKPPRIADVVALGKGGPVYDGLVDLGYVGSQGTEQEKGKVLKWEAVEGVQPLVSLIDSSFWNIQRI